MITRISPLVETFPCRFGWSRWSTPAHICPQNALPAPSLAPTRPGARGVDAAGAAGGAQRESRTDAQSLELAAEGLRHVEDAFTKAADKCHRDHAAVRRPQLPGRRDFITAATKSYINAASRP
ncbi:hypothetical protein [Streptomyces agglomeratus]|uniref:hypothetical protein n=1 Tax=Streptomyces agglomeratus TaxID=285458 RepID=UPI000D1A916E|nr:hypothetical protein [Streptomyces agglomeratus]